MSQGTKTSAQPKPPWQKRMGEEEAVEEGGEEGCVERSSRGPEGVGMKVRTMGEGRGVEGGRVGDQVRCQRVEVGSEGAGMLDRGGRGG